MVDRPIPDSIPAADYWRSLSYFNLYRLILASLFIFLAVTFGRSLTLGDRNWKLFFGACVIYAAIAAISFVLVKLRRPRFTVQLALLIVADIAGITAISYASGGIQSSVGLFLLISLAAAGMVSRGKMTLFYAALASVAALLEHTYAVLFDRGMLLQYVQVGLLCVSYFAVAWLAHNLAKYAVASQLLAQRRGHDLASLSEANRLVMRDMQDGVLVVDDAGSIIQMNPGAERLLHKDVVPGSLLADSFPLLFGQYALWKQALGVSRGILQMDAGAQVRLRFVPVDTDAARGALIFLEDMQRVQAEAQQIKLAALGRLTANIAHEVRNPLSAISYATELLQEEQADARQRRMLQIVLDNTQRINRIVHDVMQLNRRDRAQPEEFDLATMLRVFADEFILAERVEPGVMALTTLTDFTVSFDRGHLRQVLWNLCGNALRYCRQQEGSLTIAMRDNKGSAVLEVRDDGPGISAEHLGKLFEPFFTTALEGSGLGLYIAKELCEANNAALSYCAPRSHSGGCFCITFGKTNREDGKV